MDDWGADTAVNEAVCRLAAAGRISATSAQVGGPAWRSGLADLRGLDAARMDVGLHLDFTEHPLDAAQRRPLARLIALALARRLDVRALRREIAAQLDAFEDGLGRPPAHVDGHQHVHQLPQLRDALWAELQARYGPAAQRPWLRVSLPPRSRWRDAGGKAAVIGALGGAALAREARARGWPHSRRLLGIARFDGDEARYAAQLQGWLSDAQDGDVLMCHPAVPRDAATGGDAIVRDAAPTLDALAHARAAEWRVWSGPGLPDRLRQAGVAVCPLQT